MTLESCRALFMALLEKSSSITNRAKDNLLENSAKPLRKQMMQHDVN